MKRNLELVGLLLLGLLALSSLGFAQGAKNKIRGIVAEVREPEVANPVDHCNVYPTCQECLANNLCGWCSTPVVYQDGAKGYQCAGFNQGGVNGSDPFICYGIYSTEQCSVGYVCQQNTSTCVETAPGNGVPLSECNATCANGGHGNGTQAQTYTCVNNTCVETTPGHGSSLPICQQSCGHNPPATNGTPAAIVGVWRGLQINNNYEKGEWQLNFEAYTVDILPPTGEVYQADVGVVGPYLQFNYTSGPQAGETVLILYGLYYGPTTVWATFAAGAPGAPAPTNYDIAMNTPGYTEFVFVHCLSATYCNFTFEGASSNSAPFIEFEESYVNHTDHCSPYPNCTSCLEHQYCGWCSVPVVYQDGSKGANCAGFNDNSTSDPFKCIGTYSTEVCPGPAPTYLCDNATKTCVQASPGQGTSLLICNQTCGVPPPPPPPPPAKTYVCIQENNTCVETTPGHGTSLLVCNQTCNAANNNNTNNHTHPAQTYVCNNFNKTCMPAPPGVGTSLQICNQTCGQLTPPPTELDGIWRGLMVNENYLFGEWDAKFANTSMSLVDPTGRAYTAQVALVSGGDLQIEFDDGTFVLGQFQLAYGPETVYLTLALSAANAEVAPDFVTAMDTSGDTEFNFIRCLDDSTNCSFFF